MEEIRTEGAAGTQACAAGLARRLEPGAVIALHGELGSGKTCFVQGLGRGLRVREPVRSPTFTLINEYHGDLTLHHVDLYRLNDLREARDMGLDACIEDDGVTVIEWAERASDLLPPRTLHVEFRIGERPDARVLRLWREGEP